MVVCKCRKATKLYCFVHKVPVCGECIGFPEHQICVIRTYSEWVVDGEYDWPSSCCQCQVALEEGSDSQTTRLGCLHLIHTNCLVSHIKSFPPHTAPAGYVCPSCSTSIWPPKNIKDSGSRLHSKLKEAIMLSGLEKNLFGNHPVSLATPEYRAPPSAFGSEPLMTVGPAVAKDEANTNGYSAVAAGIGSSKHSASDIVEVDGPTLTATQAISEHDSSFLKNISPSAQPGATTRKNTFHVDRQTSETSYYADDEDGNRKKYNRRGSFRHKFLRALLPFWSSALPTLPVTAPSRKDAPNIDDAPEGRQRHQKSSRVDPRKILLLIALMACMAVMGILYYRLAQGVLGDEQPDDEQR